MPPRLGMNTYGYEQEKKSEAQRSTLRKKIETRERMTQELEKLTEKSQNLNLKFVEMETRLSLCNYNLKRSEVKQKMNYTKLFYLEERFAKEMESLENETSFAKKARISTPLNEVSALDKKNEIEEKYIKEKTLLNNEFLKLKEEEGRASAELPKLKLEFQSIKSLIVDISNKITEVKGVLRALDRTR